MTKLGDLFLRAKWAFETTEDELTAVYEGKKAIAWYPMSAEQVEEHRDYDDLVALAKAMSLSIVTCPREAPADMPAGAPTVDVFVHRGTDCWRVNALRACEATLGRYQWSDSSEYLHSLFLGYPEESCRRWIAQRRHNRLGWVGQTVYCLLDRSDVDKLALAALRCFPPDFDIAHRIVFSHPAGFLLREDPESALPGNVWLCRFALENSFFLSLFEKASEKDDIPLTVQVGVDAEEVNSRLLSAIEIWWERGWRSQLPAQ